ncbi:glutamine ABC transporter substrate-binding protein [Streptococcus azizii]|uniref:Glutamine ABC transporter substrate-binding protein n=1 Tax=Streptococcus azizii TaxID=1579424 RepID=A0AB36JMI3_9STRE|nr:MULTISPECIES: amino acid ABC transporter substrate-binding protein [Streptococcus]MBF0776938.1 amino acid ABC transporter substrate-binding protein [Streptococcus sp. 19428wD3_AN2]ONK25660.1 glutamine ABC transporter substrate-binding protein [Streptococcus azizii]ONK27628.1 glutamine ABC transporter substrate-binding protein [Streptococcus azizii]ONK29808.1 glutamine ABC transporter substrate-binding protein [Streptococcus azizii]TFU82086.1 amino acid ABC transporter substrate-binding prot
MKMKSIVIGLVGMVASFALAACGTGDSVTKKDNWSRYEESKKITIGFDKTFVPMGFEEKNGQYTGFDIELAKAVFDKYGLAIEWQPIDWDLKETELNNGNIDLIWNGYSATAERREKVLFTDNYMENLQVLVTKKSSNITNSSGMKDKVLGAQAGSSGYTNFESQPTILKDLVKNNEATQYATFNEALIDLKNDRIDGLLIDRVYANYYLQQEGLISDYNIIDAGFEKEAFGVGARKADTTLVDKINAAFKELYADGSFQKISDKWFGEDVATDVIKGK